MTKDVKMCCTAIYDRTTALTHLPFKGTNPETMAGRNRAHIARQFGTSRVTYIVENIVPPNTPTMSTLMGG